MCDGSMGHLCLHLRSFPPFPWEVELFPPREHTRSLARPAPPTPAALSRANMRADTHQLRISQHICTLRAGWSTVCPATSLAAPSKQMCAALCCPLLHASVSRVPGEHAAIPAGPRKRGAATCSTRGGTREQRRRERGRPRRIAAKRRETCVFRVSERRKRGTVNMHSARITCRHAHCRPGSGMIQRRPTTPVFLNTAGGLPA